MGLFKRKPTGMPDKFKNENGIILSKNYAMETDTQKKGVHNNNVVVIGQSGVGKTRAFVIPNILQKNANYIINDKNGEIYDQTANELEAAGYNIVKVTIDEIPEYLYIFNETTKVEDVESYIKTIYKNSEKTDAYWGKLEQDLCSAIVWCFLLQNKNTAWGFKKMLDMLNMFYEQQDEKTTKLDIFMEKIAEMNPGEAGSELTKLYEPFKRLHSSNKKLVVDALKTKLTPFFTKKAPQTIDLTKDKTAVYVTYGENEPNTALLLSVFYLYITKTLYAKEAPFTEIILDQFNDIGEIDAMARRTTQALRNNVSIIVTTESLTALAPNYEQDYLIDSFDTIVFMGSYNTKTMEFIRQTAELFTQRYWDIKDIQKLTPNQVLILMSRTGVYADGKR